MQWRTLACRADRGAGLCAEAATRAAFAEEDDGHWRAEQPGKTAPWHETPRTIEGPRRLPANPLAARLVT